MMLYHFAKFQDKAGPGIGFGRVLRLYSVISCCDERGMT